jgi:hypothetical protein
MKSNRTLVNVYSTESVITVENCAKRIRSDLRSWGQQEVYRGISAEGRVCTPVAVRACSACAGDYEDPDRTAWTPGESEDDEGQRTPGTSAEEFPAET